MSTPIAYTYEADYHCEACAEAAFGRDENGDITGTDGEGNPVGVIAPWNEWQQFDGERETLACGDCGAVLDEYDPEA